MDASRSRSSKSRSRSQLGTNNEVQSSGQDRQGPGCSYGVPSSKYTTWTNENLGHRFLAVLNGKVCCCGVDMFKFFLSILRLIEWNSHNFNGCGFLEWIDPKMCKRSIQVILGLLMNINKYEEERGMKKSLISRMDVWTKMIHFIIGEILESKIRNWSLLLIVIVVDDLTEEEEATNVQINGCTKQNFIPKIKVTNRFC